MSTADYALYAAQLVGGIVYALFLEFVLKRRYEIKGHTWGTVVGGVAMVGLIVAGRLAWWPLPALVASDLVWWSWWLWTGSFFASGAPIIIWQFIVHDRNVTELRGLEAE